VEVTSRYPETLEKMARIYTAQVVSEMMRNTREAIKWIKTQL